MNWFAAAFRDGRHPANGRPIRFFWTALTDPPRRLALHSAWPPSFLRNHPPRRVPVCVAPKSSKMAFVRDVRRDPVSGWSKTPNLGHPETGLPDETLRGALPRTTNGRGRGVRRLTMPKPRAKRGIVRSTFAGDPPETPFKAGFGQNRKISPGKFPFRASAGGSPERAKRHFFGPFQAGSRLPDGIPPRKGPKNKRGPETPASAQAGPKPSEIKS